MTMSEEKMKGYLTKVLQKDVSDSIRPAARVRIGERIATIRKAQGMTQQELADHSDVLRPNLARIEKGRVSVGIDALDSIAKALGMEIDLVNEEYNALLCKLFVYSNFTMERKHHIGQMVRVHSPDFKSHGHMAEIQGKADDGEWTVEGLPNDSFDGSELNVVYDGYRQRVVIDFYDDGLLGVGFTQGYEDDPEFAELQPLNELGHDESIRIQEACLEVASIIRHSHSRDDRRWEQMPVAKDKY